MPLINELLFFNELKLFAAMPEVFQKKMEAIMRSLRNCLEKVEGDARSNIISQFGKGRKGTVDARFPDMDATIAFLFRLIELRSEFHKHSPNEILPPNFGEHTNEALLYVVSEYQNQVKGLDTLLQPDPVDKPFDMVKILSTLQVLKERSTVFSKASDGLQQLSDLCSGSDATVVDYAADPLLGVAERVRNFVNENFRTLPELNKKIALSSERSRAFQLLGKRIATDSSALSNLIKYVRDDPEVAEALTGYRAKVQAAGLQLWADTNKLLGQVSSDAKIEKYRSDGYLASTDPELEGQRKICEQLNILYDHLELFQKHVSPNLPPSSVAFDLPSLGVDLLDKMGAISEQITAVPADDLDGVAGVLVCLQICYQELLFQRSDCKKVVEKCLEKYQTTSAGKGSGISKLGFKLAGSKFRPYGEQIVQSYDAFQGYRAKAFREKTARFKEDYVLREMKCTNQEGKALATNNSILLEMFKEFDKEYKEIVDRCLRDGFGEAAGSFVVQRLRTKVQSLRLEHTSDSIKWTQEMRNAVPTMVAQIFAVWTFHHSKRFLSAMDGEDKESYLFMPHPVQIIAIFCMLGLDSPGGGRGPSADLERSLVQVTRLLVYCTMKFLSLPLRYRYLESIKILTAFSYTCVSHGDRKMLSTQQVIFPNFL